jgi:2-oxoglutarate dehydrogenase E2 component (dihydrolipoamide succinyltransferase)
LGRCQARRKLHNPRCLAAAPAPSGGGGRDVYQPDRTMPTPVIVPQLGESISQAVLLRWLKKDGEQVAKGEPIAEFETDKANVEMPSEESGVLQTTGKPGETYNVGQTIGTLSEAGAAPAKAAAPAPKMTTAPTTSNESGSAHPKPGVPSPADSSDAPAAAGELAAAKTDDLRPSVRRLVEENKLDPSTISATGPGGKIIKEDVTRHLESKAAAPTPAAETKATPAAPPAAQQAPASQPATPAPGSRPLPPTGDEKTIPFDAAGLKRVPMSKIRKRIAATLVEAQRTAAILTTFNEVDMSQIMALRAKFKDRFAEVHKVGLGFMSFFGRAVVLAMKEFPRVNAKIDGDDIVYHNHVHLGIAVSTERGLAVPVLRNADAMGFAKIESEIKRLATAVKDGKLGLQELTGGTFSITNGGVFGSLLSTPILNPPQSAILGMHAIQQRPVAVDGKVEIRPMMYVALSYDHRLVDGRESVSFLVRMKQYLEDPARLMLEV